MNPVEFEFFSGSLSKLNSTEKKNKIRHNSMKLNR